MGLPVPDSSPRSSSSGDRLYHVMVVDDSIVVRGLLARALESDPQIAVVASVGNGQLALNALSRAEVDVVVLDVEMPVMDGLTALPKLMAADPDLKIIMASTLTQRNAEISLQALAAGAADYIAKPRASGELVNAAAFKRELIDKVKALGASRRSRAGRARTRPAAGRAIELAPRPRAVENKPIVLRAPSSLAPQLLAIGSSTGGPQALFTLLRALPASVQAPILITQHMPPTFTRILAEHLSRLGPREAAEAVEGEPVRPNRIYLAPGDYHMKVVAQGGERAIQLSKEPPENFCRPAVDVMLRSLVGAYGGRMLSVILTGMGQDGLKGAELVVKAGGTVVAQDEETSVVWGMPGVVAGAGLCSAVLPLAEIATYAARLFGGRAS